MPRLGPPLRASSSWTSQSGSARAMTGSTSMTTSSGTRSPRRRAISPATTSATSAFGPWPAPVNFAT